MKDTTPATHSPLPWEAETGKFAYGEFPCITNSNGMICAMHSPFEEGKANAAYLVKCANAHPLLVEALKEVHGRMERRYIEEELRMGARRPMEGCEPLYQKITALLASLQS